VKLQITRHEIFIFKEKITKIFITGFLVLYNQLQVIQVRQSLENNVAA
jgi:hypothetical protein